MQGIRGVKERSGITELNNLHFRNSVNGNFKTKSTWKVEMVSLSMQKYSQYQFSISLFTF